MGLEFLLLFGLGVTGVVLTNLLTGDTTTEVRPSTGNPVADAGRPVPTAEAVVDAPTEADLPAAVAEVGGTAEEVTAPLATLPHEDPRLWGHPAPLARLLALVVVSAAVLCSVLWGLGWFAAQAIARAIGG